MIKKIKKLVEKLLNKQAVLDLDNDGKIESYREEIKGVFHQFNVMYEKLDEVNGKLTSVINDEQENVKWAESQMARSKERIAKAQAEQDINAKHQDKLKEFIV